MAAANETDLLEPPVIDIDPFGPEARNDPYAFYRQVRDTAPVVWFSKHKTYGVARYEEVQQVQKNHEIFMASAGSGLSDTRLPGSWREGANITSSDPPEHTPLRAIMNKILSPVIIRGWREAFEREGSALIDRLIARRRFDVVHDLAEAFVVSVFPPALGVRMTRDQAVLIGNLNFNALGPPNDLFEKSRRDAAPFEDFIARSRTRDGVIPGGFAEKIFDAEDAGQVPKGAASGLMLALVRGGMDTTISAIGNAFHLLATNPEQWKLFRQDPALARNVFDETLRIASPIQTYYRTTTRPASLSGMALKGNAKVQMLVGSANRDPRRWDNPDMFDIRRVTIGQLALGTGVHNCVGQMIARLEGEAVLRPFAGRVAGFELDGPAVRRPNNSLWTLESLPVRVAPD